MHKYARQKVHICTYLYIFVHICTYWKNSRPYWSIKYECKKTLVFILKYGPIWTNMYKICTNMCKYAPLIWVEYARWPLYWGRFASSIFSCIGDENMDQYGPICTKHLIKKNIFSKYWAHTAADCANIAVKGMKEKPMFSSIFHIYPY